MKITRSALEGTHLGGTVTYVVFTDDDRMIGLIGDGRDWRGHRYGGRRWWAAWRQEGDTAARWNSGGLAYRTRAAALSALASAVEGQS
jgi:hypothetical protein